MKPTNLFVSAAETVLYLWSMYDMPSPGNTLLLCNCDCSLGCQHPDGLDVACLEALSCEHQLKLQPLIFSVITISVTLPGAHLTTHMACGDKKFLALDLLGLCLAVTLTVTVALGSQQ